MNRDENLVCDYLQALNLGEVQREPDGKVPPDFLVDGCIAVEARRLSKHYRSGDKLRSLEEDSIPLKQSIVKLLAELGSNADERTWFVMFDFRRPLVDRTLLRRDIRSILKTFLGSPSDRMSYRQVGGRFGVTISRSSEFLGQTFVYGGHTDRDAGGWIVSDVVENLRAYISEKSQKVAAYRHKYPVWWLVFVDYIARPSDREDVRKHIQRPKDWDRVVVLNHDGRAYDI